MKYFIGHYITFNTEISLFLVNSVSIIPSFVWSQFKAEGKVRYRFLKPEDKNSEPKEASGEGENFFKYVHAVTF